MLKIRRFEDPAWIDSDATNAAEDILTAQEALKEELETVDADDDVKIDELVQQNLSAKNSNVLKTSLLTTKTLLS